MLFRSSDEKYNIAYSALNIRQLVISSFLLTLIKKSVIQTFTFYSSVITFHLSYEEANKYNFCSFYNWILQLMKLREGI